MFRLLSDRGLIDVMCVQITEEMLANCFKSCGVVTDVRVCGMPWLPPTPCPELCHQRCFPPYFNSEEM